MRLFGRRIIVYELNEVPDRVVDWFVLKRPRGALALLLNHGTRISTFANERTTLSPWITWSTVHRGVNVADHGITDFGQDQTRVNREYPQIWSRLADAGVRTGVFGSLHTYHLLEQAERYAFLVPDTFAAGPETSPESLQAFQRFNLDMVDASARNVSTGLSVRSGLNMLRAGPSLGLRPATIARLAYQLVSERVRPPRKVRRRTSQIQLAFDLFMRQLELQGPHFSTFFTNHVASAMHRYWPAAFPADYQLKKLPEHWLATFKDEVYYSMTEADRQLARLRSFVKNNPEYVLVVASSMGQAAVDTAEIVRTQLYVKNLASFMLRLGVPPGEWTHRRGMLPRYIVHVTDSVAAGFRENLGRFRINGECVSYEEHEACVFSIKLGHVNLVETDIRVSIGTQHLSIEEMALENVAIEDETGSYAYHTPDGFMLLYDPVDEHPQAGPVRVDTTAIAPFILQNFGLQIPSYMSPEL